MRIKPFISILIILLISLYQGVNAQIPGQDGSMESLFSHNSAEQISTQVQKLFLEGLLAVNNTFLEDGLTLLLQAEKLDPNQSGITHAIANIYFNLNDYHICNVSIEILIMLNITIIMSMLVEY